MKRIACYALHYGAEYLAWSIRSVQDAVDEIHVFYTPVPSYGHWDPNSTNPDTEADLRREAHRFLHKPLIWHTINARTEGEHRDNMIRVAHEVGAEQYLVVDADEVWNPEAARETLDAVAQANRAGRWLARFANFWRSTKWMVHDHFMPIRVVDMRHSLQQDAYLTPEMQPLPVYHFGYAQTLRTMNYKLGCHGHKAEFKPGWYENKFINWTPEATDLHPCVNNLWDRAHPTDPGTLTQVKKVLEGHPYLDLEIIK
jgi:hypothetical protein